VARDPSRRNATAPRSALRGRAAEPRSPSLSAAERPRGCWRLSLKNPGSRRRALPIAARARILLEPISADAFEVGAVRLGSGDGRTDRRSRAPSSSSVPAPIARRRGNKTGTHRRPKLLHRPTRGDSRCVQFMSQPCGIAGVQAVSERPTGWTFSPRSQVRSLPGPFQARSLDAPALSEDEGQEHLGRSPVDRVAGREPPIRRRRMSSTSLIPTRTSTRRRRHSERDVQRHALKHHGSAWEISVAGRQSSPSRAASKKTTRPGLQERQRT
jgi:hypothetical protein